LSFLGPDHKMRLKLLIFPVHFCPHWSTLADAAFSNRFGSQRRFEWASIPMESVLASVLSCPRSIASSTFRNSFLKILWLHPTFFDLSWLLDSCHSFNFFRSPYLGFPRAFLMLPDLGGSSLTVQFPRFARCLLRPSAQLFWTSFNLSRPLQCFATFHFAIFARSPRFNWAVLSKVAMTHSQRPLDRVSRW
jgi:hypothetical protein